MHMLANKIMVKERLLSLVDETYREFHAKLIPGMRNNLGVRTPELRKLAKELAKTEGLAYLKEATDDSYEEILLQGMVIGYVNVEQSERLKAMEWFIPKIDNWATCDLFVSTLKFTKKNEALVWDWLQTYFNSDKEYEIRFAVVMGLSYYLHQPYLQRLYPIFDSIQHEGYYVKMAIAWAVSIAYIKEPVETMQYLQNCHLDTYTYNKAIQKIRESYRVETKEKERLQAMKRQ